MSVVNSPPSGIRSLTKSICQPVTIAHSMVGHLTRIRMISLTFSSSVISAGPRSESGTGGGVVGIQPRYCKVTDTLS